MIITRLAASDPHRNIRLLHRSPRTNFYLQTRPFHISPLVRQPCHFSIHPLLPILFLSSSLFFLFFPLFLSFSFLFFFVVLHPYVFSLCISLAFVLNVKTASGYVRSPESLLVGTEQYRTERNGADKFFARF